MILLLTLQKKNALLIDGRDLTEIYIILGSREIKLRYQVQLRNSKNMIVAEIKVAKFRSALLKFQSTLK